MESFTPVVIGGYKYVSKGGEYIGEEFRQYCLETGIIREFTATNTPQQVGVSERVGRTLCTMVRCILVDSGFPSSTWRELFMAAAYLKNRTPNKALKMETLFKMLQGEEADLSHLDVIGARTFVHIKDSKSSTTWPGKGRCAAIARRENLTKFATLRLTVSWKAGTSPSWRNRRTCLPRL